METTQTAAASGAAPSSPSDSTAASSVCSSRGKPCRIPWRGVMALLGGFLIQLTLGSFYSFGNMMTYMTSYMRKHGAPDLTYGDFIVVQSVWGMTQGTIFPLSGFLIRVVGRRVAMVGGCVIFSMGAALTYFTIDSGNVWLVALTYGFVSAFGQGIALIPTMTIGMRWFPERKGMAMGIVVGGFGGGAFIFNQIQTAILNPDNVNVDPDTQYFTDEELLSRVPNLMLILAGIYLALEMVACAMVTEPTVTCSGGGGGGASCSTSLPKKLSRQKEEKGADKGQKCNGDVEQHVSSPGRDSIASGGSRVVSRLSSLVNKGRRDNDNGEVRISPAQALKSREFYILWITRFSVVLITQTIAGFYKAFGQTFILDDHFLSLVGAVCSIFNCTGRLFYGMLMDRTTYRTAMTTETVLLGALFASLISTSYLGKAAFAIWIWSIFFTFPGTYSTQPAVTTQTFGHKHGGTIYGFLFTSDIVNNLLVGGLSKPVLEEFGWVGLFTILAGFAGLGVLVTCFFPWHPSPQVIRGRLGLNNSGLAAYACAEDSDEDEGDCAKREEKEGKEGEEEKTKKTGEPLLLLGEKKHEES